MRVSVRPSVGVRAARVAQLEKINQHRLVQVYYNLFGYLDLRPDSRNRIGELCAVPGL